MSSKPDLSDKLTVSQFKSFYWKKSELIEFCRQNNIATQGNKEYLAQTIENFISSGVKPAKKIKKKPKVLIDSAKQITLSTPVINYRNDLKTREFFISKIGNKFKFNYYLRDFAKQRNDGNLTYGDLVTGYKASLTKKQQSIGKQFKYNQFQRDFYKNNPNNSRTDCIEAWNLIKSVPGDCSYKSYLELISTENK